MFSGIIFTNVHINILVSTADFFICLLTDSQCSCGKQGVIFMLFSNPDSYKLMY